VSKNVPVRTARKDGPYALPVCTGSAFRPLGPQNVSNIRLKPNLEPNNCVFVNSLFRKFEDMRLIYVTTRHNSVHPKVDAYRQLSHGIKAEKRGGLDYPV